MPQQSHPGDTLQDLPQPDAGAMAHSRRLQAHIRDQVAAAGGWISLAQFMELALYAPGLGYYSAGSAKLGEAGDFVTAPEISSLFGRCLAGQVALVLRELGGGGLLELGAGSGALAAELLAQLHAEDSLPDEYLILEVSAQLRQQQQQRLARCVPELAGRVRWLDTLPQAFSGVMVANEVLDALPVERFEIGAGQLLQQGVEWRAGRLALGWRPACEAVCRRVRHVLGDLEWPLPEGYRSEVSLAVEPWLASLADGLDRGAMLLVDYGLPRSQYYHPQRSDGTLICHYRHRAHGDLLHWVGLQDITAWVDFTAVAEAAVSHGLEIMGFTTQAHFLLGAGMERLLVEAAPDSLREQLRLAGEVRKLTLPGEMGERFKVMGLCRSLDLGLPGFALQDLTASL